MSDDLVLGMIGAGNIAIRYLANLEFLGRNRIVGLCDLDLDKAKELSGRCGAKPYTNFEEMFDREPGLDAVVICTPPIVRRSIFELAIERGIGVYCEKPPADTLEEAKHIAHMVDGSDIICSVGFHMRYSPSIDRFRELMEGRTVNFVQSISAGSSAVTRSLDDWFFLKEKSGGHIMDQAIHSIDLMRLVVGEISHVQTFGNNIVCPKMNDFTIEDTTCTNIRFAGGASGSHIHSWAAQRGINELMIAGADFTFSLAPHSPPRVSGWIGEPGQDHEKVDQTFPQGPAMGRSGRISEKRRLKDPPDPPHCESMQVFLEAVRTGDGSRIRSLFSNAVQSLATVLAMNRSIDSGQVEVVELSGEPPTHPN